MKSLDQQNQEIVEAENVDIVNDVIVDVDLVDAEIVSRDKAGGQKDISSDENDEFSELSKFGICCLIAASVQIYLLDI